jgi:hypothetical protein
MSPDHYRDAMGAALLRNSREKLCELVANGSDSDGLRAFIAGLDAHFGSGAIRAVAVTAEPGSPEAPSSGNLSCGSSREARATSPMLAAALIWWTVGLEEH